MEATHIMYIPSKGKLGMVNEDDDDDDNVVGHKIGFIQLTQFYTVFYCLFYFP